LFLFKEVTMFYIVQFRRPKWLLPWDEVVYLNKDLMEMVTNESMASVFEDTDTAEQRGKQFRTELFDNPVVWKMHIVPVE
jgi:hypothetical protein